MDVADSEACASASTASTKNLGWDLRAKGVVCGVDGEQRQDHQCDLLSYFEVNHAR
jgi:hypothetical protein